MLGVHTEAVRVKLESAPVALFFLRVCPLISSGLNCNQLYDA